MSPRPPGVVRTASLVARLLTRRFLNRFRIALSGRKKTVGKRTGTPRKAALGWAGISFIGLLMLFNAINLTSRVLDSVETELGPPRDEAGRYVVSARTLSELGELEDDDDAAEREPHAAIILANEARTGLGEQREEWSRELMKEYRARGLGAFSEAENSSREFLLPRIAAWHAPIQGARVLRMMTGLVLLLAVAWLCIGLGSGNQDLGKVEWTLEWLFTFPIAARNLFLAQILGQTVADPLLWAAGVPMLFTIFWSADFGGWSFPMSLAAGLFFGLQVTSVRIASETVLRTRATLPQLKNLQALFTVVGIIALFLLIANVGQSPITHHIRAFGERLPEWTTWLPAALPLHLCSGDPLPAVWAAIGACAIAVPFSAMVLCAWLVRSGLVSSTGAYAGKRHRAPESHRERPTPRGILGKDLRLLLRDRNFFVQTLVIPALLVGIQLVLNVGILEAVRTSFQHGAVLAFSIGAYVLVATALSVLAVEGNALWMLYTMPRSIPAVLFEKTVLWAGFALAYTTAVLAACAWYNPHLAPADAGFAIVALLGVGIYAFIAAGIGILGTDPLEPEVRRRVRPEMAQLYMLLAAMFGFALYAPSTWARLGQIILSALLAFALWQKVRDRAPFLLDPVAAPPPSLSLSDGLIAALAFFVLQGVCLMGFVAAEIPPGASLFMAFVIAGAIVVAFTLYLCWRAKVPRLLESVGLRRGDSSDRGMSTLRAAGLGVASGAVAGMFGWGYLRAMDHVPTLRALKVQALDLPFDFGWWFPLLAIGAAPLFEEFIFRGLVFQGLRRSAHAALAIVASAAIFAIVHPAISVIPVFVLGLAAAWSFERSKLLISSIAAHMVYNALIFLAQAP